MPLSNRRFAIAAACKPHARALHARTEKRPAHGARKRAIRKPLRLRNAASTASLRNVSQTLHNDA
eukprot:10095383-Lingulodinium_polyedra.AAC.1